MIKFFLLLLLFVSSGIGFTFACSFDVDCSPGSRCVKSRGGIYGVCLGGLFPGNSNDAQPVINLLDLNGTYGNTCAFNIDCGPGSKCIKGSGIEGTCLPAR